MEEYINRDYLDTENLFLGKDITVYVEGLEDVLFWEDIFRKFAPNLKLKFEYESRDNPKNGKQEVLKNLRNACQTVILCLDSDLDYLLKNEPIFSNPYIFHTYTYAIENYKIFPYNLNIIVKKCSLPLQQDFCFVKFFKAYSKAVYPLFLYILYFEQKKYDSLRQGENVETENLVSWTKLKSVLCCDQSNIDLTNNGFNIIQSLKEKINQLTLQLIDKYGDIDLTLIENQLKQEYNINPEDIYWYLQGHILYDCVACQILEKLIKKYSKEVRDNYKNEINNNPENKAIKDKKNEYDNFLKQRNWKTLLQEGYNACLIYLDQCSPMQKIKVRIEEYMLKFSH